MIEPVTFEVLMSKGKDTLFTGRMLRVPQLGERVTLEVKGKGYRTYKVHQVNGTVLSRGQTSYTLTLIDVKDAYED